MGRVRVGTCSWTEKTMVGLWYPKGVTTSEERLRYYASKFDTVEVDSSFYAIPRREYAEAWVERTPDGFVFHVKAYGLMTGHEVDERSLAPELREFDHAVDRGRILGAHPDMVDGLQLLVGLPDAIFAVRCPGLPDHCRLARDQRRLVRTQGDNALHS